MTPPQPDRSQEVEDQVLDWMQANAAKIIATRIVPWALPAIGIFVAWAQNVLGLDLTQTEVTGIVSAALLGAAGVLFAWVRGRMHRQTEVAKVLLELQKLQVMSHDTLPPGFDAGFETLPANTSPASTGSVSSAAQSSPPDEVVPTQPPGLEPRG